WHDSAYRLWLFWSDEPRNCGRSEVDIQLDSISLRDGATYTLGAQPANYNDSTNAQWASFTEEPCNGLPTAYITTAGISGQVTISWFDPVTGIVAGTFSFDAVDGVGDTVHVRQGRFDMMTH
ncbi:MAG TPA: DUF6252 family protein, partial [Puia sp.]|nr:DUF6252 family protein [Puia sp.]